MLFLWQKLRKRRNASSVQKKYKCTDRLERQLHSIFICGTVEKMEQTLILVFLLDLHHFIHFLSLRTFEDSIRHQNNGRTALPASILWKSKTTKRELNSTLRLNSARWGFPLLGFSFRRFSSDAISVVYLYSSTEPRLQKSNKLPISIFVETTGIFSYLGE